jgi:hypothetical protein
MQAPAAGNMTILYYAEITLGQISYPVRVSTPLKVTTLTKIENQIF